MNEYGYGGSHGRVFGDSRVAISDGYETNASKGEAFLYHSCDDWCIGDADNVRLMIADLQELLTKMDSVNHA